MKITVKRSALKKTYTIGHMYIDGKFLCDTLEDTDRGLDQSMSEDEIKRIKIPGSTAIPTGTYKVTYTYSTRFKKFLPVINDVKGYEGIRIHSGNTDKDSSGCLLLGENKVVGKLINSAKALAAFTSILKPAIASREDITITIGYK